MKAHFKKNLFLLCFLFFIGCESSPRSESNANNSKVLLQGKTMGTSYHVVIIHSKEQPLKETQIKGEIDTLLKNINLQVSTYNPDSRISQFNQSNPSDWFTVDKDFFTVVEAAQEISKKSDGAFDISISPIVDLWGFGANTKTDIPSANQIKNTLADIGYQKLLLDKNKSSIKKTSPTLQIDLSAIAKGYAVDRISDYLSEKGFSNHLVEIGGELRASGSNQQGKKWRIAVEQPDSNTIIPNDGLEINNHAIATSGDYRNYFFEKGVRRSHIIDPNTGYPITHTLASVTVLHHSAMLADAYATALLVMGEKRAKVFIDENNLSALLITRDKDGFVFWNSPNFFKK